MRRMRYHLDIRNGSDLIEDWEGADHPDLASALREAIASARNMLAECVRDGLPFGDRKFEIRDEQQRLVQVLPFIDALPDMNVRMLAAAAERTSPGASMAAVVKSVDAPAFRNAILRGLPVDEVEALLPHLVLVGLERQQVLNAAGIAPDHVYFPEGGILSFVIPMPSSGQVEFGLLGRDGLSSLSAAWSERPSPVDVVVQVGDASAYRIEAETLRRLHGDSERLRLQFLEALYGFAGQMAYTAISNARHTLPQRLARWLLLCRDRLDGDDIPLTHDFMAMMLGSQRTSVTTTLHVLEGEGAIYSRRGSVEVRSRRRLEECAGEAYVSASR